MVSVSLSIDVYQRMILDAKFFTVKYIRTLSKSLRKGISIDQLFFQLNDFCDDFQQILNGTNLFTLLKLNLFCTGEWNSRTATLAVMQMPLKGNILHIDII